MRAGHHEPAHAGGADFLVVADRGRCRPVACSCPSEPRGVRRARAARTGPGAAAQPRAAHAPVKREPAWHMLPPPARAGASVHRGSGPGDRIYPTKSGRRGRMVSRHQGSRSYGSAGGLGHRHGCNARVVAIEEKPRFLVAGFQNLCTSTQAIVRRSCEFTTRTEHDCFSGGRFAREELAVVGARARQTTNPPPLSKPRTPL